MTFDLNRGIEVLERTPAVLRALLEGLSVDWIVRNEGGESWSPFNVVGHLIDGERTDWIPRARIILAREERPFDPFDRFHHLTATLGKPLSQLLDTFAQLRSANVRILKSWNLSETLLDLTGTHPALGPVTLRQLLATWVAHDLGHIGQIVRVMARQYDQEVGPWKEYLPVLQQRQ
jgi:uncharacterized damage-inducible protein DinB